MKDVERPRSHLLFREAVGSFADIGTLLPLTIGLIIYSGISPSRAFILLGLSYIFVGLFYKLPVPVQPLKATAMIAIATGATRAQISAAALLIAAILLLFSMTGFINKLNQITPKVLVRGLQLGLGLLMIKTGTQLMMHYHSGMDSTLRGIHSTSANLFPSFDDFRMALIALVLPQIPLTLGNSIVATHDCALKYFGDKGARVSANRLAATISLGNIAAGIFGGIPICHGAGGMTAHYRFGARSGIAGLIIGSVLFLVGLFSKTLLGVIASIPAIVLGLLLFYVGIRHAALAQNELMRFRTAGVVIAMAMLSLFTGNMMYALAGGLLVKLFTMDISLFRVERLRAK